MIPKCIYMCYKNKNIPKKVIENWQILNPDYDIKLFDDNDCRMFIHRHFGEKHANIFNSISSGPNKADFWRLCVLYINGGVYTDIDLMPLEPLSYILQNANINFSTVLGFEKNNIFQAFLASEKNNNILKSCIDYCISNVELLKNDYFFNIRLMHSVLGNTLGVINVIPGLYINSQGKCIEILEEYTDSTWEECFVRLDGKNIFKSRYSDYDPRLHTFNKT